MFWALWTFWPLKPRRPRRSLRPSTYSFRSHRILQWWRMNLIRLTSFLVGDVGIWPLITAMADALGEMDLTSELLQFEQKGSMFGRFV